MIFFNPSGAPELACDECGCRWFDRMSGACYECGAPVGEEALAAFRRALAEHAARRTAAAPPATPADDGRPPPDPAPEGRTAG